MSSNENFNDASNSSLDPPNFDELDEWQEHLIIQNRQIDSMIDEVAFRLPSIVLQHGDEQSIMPRRRYIERQLQKGHEGVFEQYFSDNPIYPPEVFRTRFRIDRAYAGDDDVEEDRGSSKKSRTTEGDDDKNNSDDQVHISEASTIEHPTGREKAKEKRKEKATTSRESIFSNDYTATLNAMRITRDKEMETLSKMGELKLQSSMMVSKMNMLTALLNKSQLSPAEESIKNRLMAELFP